MFQKRTVLQSFLVYLIATVYSDPFLTSSTVAMVCSCFLISSWFLHSMHRLVFWSPYHHHQASVLLVIFLFRAGVLALVSHLLYDCLPPSFCYTCVDPQYGTALACNLSSEAGWLSFPAPLPRCSVGLDGLLKFFVAEFVCWEYSVMLRWL